MFNIYGMLEMGQVFNIHLKIAKRNLAMRNMKQDYRIWIDKEINLKKGK